ncbi:OmpC Outer membrane protein (porin) [Candidatus Methylopumilus planktonicus]|uniref:porin n=1 Tax=Candidatus Methylopumilus planktonicus TaxID=1581557 RepID=UPI003BEF1648
MNKNIKLAVAGAVLAMSATAANAGIIIPAGDWTLDINGNVNAYMNFTKGKDNNEVTGGLAATQATGSSTVKGINTGLLPAWIGFTGKTRQNDLDVEFTISMQPGVSANDISGDGAFVNGTTDSNGSKMLNRQTYLSFGDKSWGSFKLGKDIGIFAQDAILNDMTLLGVGSGAALSGSSANTTNGGIGTGYLYAAWKGQVAYTTPNMNGFQATVGITNPNMGGLTMSQDRFGFEGKASYSFAANDMTGKIWVSGLSNKVNTNEVAAVETLYAALGTGSAITTEVRAGVAAVPSYEYTASVFDIGANLNVAGFGLTGYYYDGRGVGTTLVGSNAISGDGARRDSNGGYVQLTYVLPVKTKLGLAYGTSRLDMAGNDANTLLKTNDRVTVGAYHPLTKHLNLVAEYNHITAENHAGAENKSYTGSLGAILFF